MATVTTEALPDDDIVREATMDDFQAVLDIDPNTFYGRDYLPANFTTLVQGQGVKAYVYIRHDKLVGFLSTKAVDGGQTVLLEAGRTHVDFRGRGFYGRLYRTVVNDIATSQPHFRHVVFGMYNDNAFRHRLKNFTVVMKRALTWMELDADQVRSELTRSPSHSSDHLHPLSPHHIHSMLNQPPSTLLHLFPQQRLLFNREPYRIMAANADVILNSCRDRVFLAATESVELIGKGGNFPITLLSCGSHYPSQSCRMCDIDIFGSGSDKEMCSHLLWHIQRSLKVATEKAVAFRIFTDTRMDDVVSLLQKQVSLHLLALPSHTGFVLEAEFKH